MTTKKKELIVTSALPYANGPLHFGHLLEHIQTDIWVRSQRILGNHCIYLCASDAHGTPIMMKAEEENISPEKLVDKYNLKQLSTGDMLREAITRGSELGEKAKSIMDRGELVSDEIILSMIREKLEKRDSNKLRL